MPSWPSGLANLFEKFQSLPQQVKFCYGFAVVFLVLGIVFAPYPNAMVAGVLFVCGFLLIVLGVIDPKSIKIFGGGSGDSKVFVERFDPTPPQRDAIIQVAVDEPTPESKEKLEEFVKEAESRPDEKRAPEDYLALAAEKWRAKDYDAALEDVFSGLLLEPKNTRVKAALINLKAGIFEDLGLADLGIKHFKEAMQIDPGFSWPHNNLGLLYRDQGKLAEAEAEHKEAIRLDPEHAKLHNNLGNLYKAQGKLEKAEAEYKEAIRLDPEDTEAKENLEELKKEMGGEG